ncbi:MAG: bifunctional lysylphosphatidylglycerol flippase/synthetase MprF, partial [Candidatus Saccharimonadales bacterium]
TNRPLHPYTKRAQLFMDSLSFVSTASVVYLVVSLVQPVRARFVDQSEQRKRIKSIMDRYGAPSEDFFKLWPKDKHYFFNKSGDAALAYYPKRGVALVLADPVGKRQSFKRLFNEFFELCWVNDWQPALIHVDAKYSTLYKSAGFQLQLIGQEAYVDLNHFCEETANNKYFRNIRNRFEKENFSFEILKPPHHPAIIERFIKISDEWLSKPGRTERGFVMGYFSEEYIQQCSVVIVRDAAQTIQAFMNIIPSLSFNKHEVTYDMMRASVNAPPNTNDFLLYSLIHELKSEGRSSLSLGLSPLVGLDEPQAEDNLVSNVLRFAYVNGDRIYSFSGLHRFKAKYEPKWEDRYLGYKGGVRGFTKMLNALVQAMRIPKSLRLKR